MVGLTLSVADGAPGELDPVAVEPLVVIQVSPASPAEQARVRAGDEILAINDVPPYVNGVPSPGVLAWITDPIDGTPITLVLHRPVTDATMTVIVTPSSSPGPSTAGGAPTTLVGPGGGEPKLVDGHIAYVMLSAFSVQATDSVLTAMTELQPDAAARRHPRYPRQRSRRPGRGRQAARRAGRTTPSLTTSVTAKTTARPTGPTTPWRC
jgi:C-terminal processing protease CtpA/Prc